MHYLNTHTKKRPILVWSVLDVKFLDGAAKSKIDITTQVGILDHDFGPRPKMITSKQVQIRQLVHFLCALFCVFWTVSEVQSSVSGSKNTSPGPAFPKCQF